METLKFGYLYFGKKNAIIGFIAEIFSFVGIFAEQMLPLLGGILIDYVIRSGEITKERVCLP